MYGMYKIGALQYLCDLEFEKISEPITKCCIESNTCIG